MKTLEEKKAEQQERRIRKIMTTCVHFNGIQHNECEAGVNYHGLLGDKPGCFAAMPCHSEGTVECPKRTLRNREEAEAEYRGREEMFARSLNAINAAHEHARANGLGKDHGGYGELPCPACEEGTLRYSVASYNGHMHGQCTTPKCVSWME